jgi:hypothetical protein
MRAYPIARLLRLHWQRCPTVAPQRGVLTALHSNPQQAIEHGRGSISNVLYRVYTWAEIEQYYVLP